MDEHSGGGGRLLQPEGAVRRCEDAPVASHGHESAVAVGDAVEIVGRARVLDGPRRGVRRAHHRAAEPHGDEAAVAVRDRVEVLLRAGRGGLPDEAVRSEVMQTPPYPTATSVPLPAVTPVRRAVAPDACSVPSYVPLA
jgi:hypothetical protein